LQGSDTQIDIDGAPALVGGDVITAIDGRPVHNMDDLITNLSRYGQVGQDSTLTILRDGQEQDITVTLMARPQSSSTETAETPNNNRARLGIVGMALTPEAAQAMELDENQQGVLIVQVQPDSGADVAGLRGSDSNLLDNGQQIMIGGDVITAVAGQAISDVPELQAIIAQAQPGDKLELTILRDGKETQLSVTLGE
jgi:S1-C subfamily serine protease